MDCHSSSTEKRNRPATDPPPPSGTGTTAQPAPAGGGLRLVARCTSPAEEGSRDLNRRQQTRPRERIDLNLTGAARKRHTLSPRIVLPAAALTPSPTTQIAAGMDSINLDKSPMGTAPLLVSSTSTSAAEEREGGSRSRRVPRQVADVRVGGQQEQHQQLEHMDTSSRTHSVSPPSIPEVGTNVEISSGVDGDLEALTRPERAAYMKRANLEGEGVEGEGNYKIARMGAGEKVGGSIRVSTIINPASPSSLTQRKKHGSKHPSPSLSPTSDHPQLSPGISSSSPSSSTPSPSPQPSQQSKLSGFTINDILKGSTNSNSSSSGSSTSSSSTLATSPRHPVPASAYSIGYPTAMLILPNMFLPPPQLPANNASFHGVPSSRDNTIAVTESFSSLSSIHRSKSPTSVSGSSSVVTPTTSSVGHYSPSTSPVQVHAQETGTVVVEIENEASEGYHSMETSDKEKVMEARQREGRGRPEGRQNALLQVSEAHLAILPDEDGDTPLHLAIIHENLSLTYYLVKLIVGVSMNLDIANNLRQTPLHLAIITRQPTAVKMLIQEGASVNFPDRRGNTSIHLASQRKELDILQVLSQAANPVPDFNARNFAGLTPVHVATKEGNIDVLKFLFQVGANRNLPDTSSGRTPLHYAVEQENFTMCNFLLENNCNVNAATFSGNTPLHIAAGRKLKEIVALLMAYGANPAIANGEGDFPSDLPASLLMQRAKMNAH